MAFRIISDPLSTGNKKVAISSLTLAIGDLIELVAGATTWTECTATSASFNRKAIVAEATTTADTFVLVHEVNGFETIGAEVTNTVAAADNGDLMVLTDKNTVNNTHTTSSTEYACFMQEALNGSEAQGRILVGNGVNPDATTS